MLGGLAAPCDRCGGEVVGPDEALTNCKASRALLVELEGGEAGKGREGHLLD